MRASCELKPYACFWLGRAGPGSGICAFAKALHYTQQCTSTHTQRTLAKKTLQKARVLPLKRAVDYQPVRSSLIFRTSTSRPAQRTHAHSHRTMAFALSRGNSAALSRARPVSRPSRIVAARFKITIQDVSVLLGGVVFFRALRAGGRWWALQTMHVSAARDHSPAAAAAHQKTTSRTRVRRSPLTAAPRRPSSRPRSPPTSSCPTCASRARARRAPARSCLAPSSTRCRATSSPSTARSATR